MAKTQKEKIVTIPKLAEMINNSFQNNRDYMDKKFGEIDEKFNQMDKEIGEVKRGIKTVDKKLITLNYEMKVLALCF